VVKSCRIRSLGSLPDGTKIVEVDGPCIRRSHVEFIQGGHGRVYRWIGKNTILVERMRDRQDECAIALHEITEHQDMKYRGLKYERAHAIANRQETAFRRSGWDMCKSVQSAWKLRWR